MNKLVTRLTQTERLNVLDILFGAIDAVCYDCVRTFIGNACVSGDRDDCPLVMVAKARAEDVSSQIAGDDQ